MGADDFLLLPYRLEAEISARLERLERLRALSQKCTTNLTGMPRATGGYGPSDVVHEIVVAEAALKKDMAHLIEAQETVSNVIDSLEDMRYRRLLQLRYQSGYTWERIAETMNYELRWIYKLRKAALARVESTIGHLSSLSDVV